MLVGKALAEKWAEKRAKGSLPVSRRSAAIVVMATLLMLCFGMATDGFTAYLPYLRGPYAVACHTAAHGAR